VAIEAKLFTELDAIGDGVKKKGKSVDSGTCASFSGENCVDTVLELGKRNLIVVEDKLATFQTLG
jgi:hypothetical protein